MKNSTKIELCGALALAAFVVLFFVDSFSTTLFINPDGKDYLSYASAILNRNFAELNPNSKFMLRSPLYPLMLSAAEALGPRELTIRLLHTLLALAAIFYSSRLLRPWINPLLSAWCALVALLTAHLFFPSVLAEWATICLLIIITAALARCMRDKTVGRLFILTLFCALGVCLRSALTPILLLPVVALYLSKLKLNASSIGALLCGILPFVILIGYNRAVLGFTGISHLGAIDFFGESTLIQEPEIDSASDENVQAFIRAYNASPKNQCGEETFRPPFVVDAVVDLRMWCQGEKARQTLGWSYVMYSEVAKKIAWLTISKHPLSYLRLVATNWFICLALTSALSWVTLALALVSATRLKKQSEYRPLIVAAVIMMAFHAVHIFFCVLVSPGVYRFVLLSNSIMFYASLLLIVASLARRHIEPNASHLL